MSLALPRTVTYSPAYTLVPTYECFNHCTYCNFRVDPGTGSWLTLAEAKAQLEVLQTQGVVEILILSGEVHPRSSKRSAWLGHIYNLCKLATDLGFLPHTNVGPLSFAEMSQLKMVNVSMGLMLEQLNPGLLQTVHRQAPSKVPGLRLQQLVWAGELQVPFTTGLLLGIGESEQDWQETLKAIAHVHQAWGHIQEVILQPHSPGQKQAWGGSAFAIERLVDVIAIARQILPADIAIQIPPNLVKESNLLLACLEAGARDLGGIGPRDEVNPDYPHPHDQALTVALAEHGWKLLPRLPIYPQYDSWLPSSLQVAVKRWRNVLKIEQSNHVMAGVRMDSSKEG